MARRWSSRFVRMTGQAPRLFGAHAARWVRGALLPPGWRAWHRRMWARYRRPTLLFITALAAAAILGGFLRGSSSRASATIAITDQEIQDEWDLLKDETRRVDLEEQVRSRAVLERALRRLGVFPPPIRSWPWARAASPSQEAEARALDRVVRAFQKRLQVERLLHSNILRITVTARDPRQAADRANAVAQAFLEERRSQAVARAEGLLTGLAEELRSVHRELEAQVASRGAFLASQGWNHYETELLHATERVARTKGLWHALEAAHEHPAAAALMTMASAQDAPSRSARVEGSAAAAADPTLEELFRHLAAAEGKLSYVMSRYKEEAPVVLQARREKEALELISRRQLQERREALERQLAREHERLELLMAQEPRARALDLAIAQAQRRYEELLSQRDKTHLQLTLIRQPSEEMGNLRLLDRAVPPPDASPWMSAALTVAKAMLLALLSVVVIPFVLFLWHAPLPDVLSLDRLRGRAPSAGVIDNDQDGNGLEEPASPSPSAHVSQLPASR